QRRVLFHRLATGNGRRHPIRFARGGPGRHAHDRASARGTAATCQRDNRRRGGRVMSAFAIAQTARSITQRRFTRAHAWIGILAVLLVLGSTPVVQAQTPYTNQIPPSYDTAGNLLRQGYIFKVHDHWPRFAGYRQLRFELQANPPLAEDATVTIRYHAYYYSVQPTLQVEQDFVLPAGKRTSTQFAMSMPSYSRLSHSVAQVWINGISQPELHTIVQNGGDRYQNHFQVLNLTKQWGAPVGSQPVNLPGVHAMTITQMPPEALS